MIWSVVVIGALVLFFTFRIRKNRLPMFTEYIRLYIGAPGSGKTFRAVREVYEHYRKQKKHHTFYKRFPKWLKWFPKFLFNGCEYEAHLLSTIPILIEEKGFGKKKRLVFCEPLRKEHLIIEDRIPKMASVLIDEAGSIFSQFDFDNPYVREQVTWLFRLWRQINGGLIIMTEQASSRIVKPVREVVGKYYYLHSWHRVLGFLPVADCSVIPMILAEDTATRINTEYNQYHLYSWLWGKRRYDSKAYSELYENPALRTCDAFDSFKSNYVIDLMVSKATMESYKKNRDFFHSWLFMERAFVRRERLEREKFEAFKNI